MTAYGTPVDSALYVEALHACRQSERITAFLDGLPAAARDPTTALIAANMGMIDAGIEREHRTRALVAGYSVMRYLKGQPNAV